MKNVYLIIVLFVFSIALATASDNKFSISTRNLIKEINCNDNLRLKSDREKAEQEISVYVVLEEGTDPYLIEEYGAKVNMVIDNFNIISARATTDVLNNIASLDQVKYIDSGKRLVPKLDVARTAIMHNNIASAVELPSAYYGKDVVVGFIDCGMQLDHINFYDEEGNLRIKRVWLQTSNSGTPPENYSYGTELTTAEEIEAKKYDNSSETHATHVGGIMAGSCKENNFYGIAPKSDIVYVSYDYTDTSVSWVTLSDAVAYIYDYAESVNKPCVVNISLGQVYGPHDGCSILDQVCDELQGEGRLLVGSVGNEGNNRQHIKKSFTSPQDTLRTFVSLLQKYNNMNAVQCDFYGEKEMNFAVKTCIVRMSTGEVVAESEAISANNIGTWYDSFSKTNGDEATGDVGFMCEIEPGSGRPHINIMALLPNITSGYSVGFKVTGDNGNNIHGWADDYFCRFTNKSNLEGWTPGDLESNIAEGGGTGKRIISVGSYKTKDFSTNSNYGEISTFSSKGPTADGRMKPDVTAPGEWIISSMSNSPGVVSSNSTNIKRGDTISVNNENFYYGSIRGTSMSSPIVAGALALWLEANPNLTPEDVREIIAETAIRDEDTGSEPNNTWGYGKFDAWSGLKEAVRLTGIEESQYNTENVGFKAYKSNGLCTLLFTQEYKNAQILFYDISGKVVLAKQVGSIGCGDEITFDESHIFNGIYLIKVVGESGTATQKVVL